MGNGGVSVMISFPVGEAQMSKRKREMSRISIVFLFFSDCIFCWVGLVGFGSVLFVCWLGI